MKWRIEMIIIKHALLLEVYIYRSYKQNPHAPKLQQNLHGVKKLQTVAKLENNDYFIHIVKSASHTILGDIYHTYTIHIEQRKKS